MKKFEKQKRDLDKVQADFTLLGKERNDAVSQLSKEMKEIERLEAERGDLFARIDAYERQKNEMKGSADVSKSMGDLNLKVLFSETGSNILRISTLCVLRLIIPHFKTFCSVIVRSRI